MDLTQQAIEEVLNDLVVQINIVNSLDYDKEEALLDYNEIASRAKQILISRSAK